MALTIAAVIVMVVFAPEERSGEVAVALSALAVVIAVVALITGPDWDVMGEELARIREAVEADQGSGEGLDHDVERSLGNRSLRGVMFAIALVWLGYRVGRRR